jgi:hypothetical protein
MRLGVPAPTLRAVKDWPKQHHAQTSTLIIGCALLGVPDPPVELPLPSEPASDPPKTVAGESLRLLLFDCAAPCVKAFDLLPSVDAFGSCPARALAASQLFKHKYPLTTLIAMKPPHGARRRGTCIQPRA